MFEQLMEYQTKSGENIYVLYWMEDGLESDLFLFDPFKETFKRMSLDEWISSLDKIDLESVIVYDESLKSIIERGILNA